MNPDNTGLPNGNIKPPLGFSTPITEPFRRLSSGDPPELITEEDLAARPVIMAWNHGKTRDPDELPSPFNSSSRTTFTRSGSIAESNGDSRRSSFPGGSYPDQRDESRKPSIGSPLRDFRSTLSHVLNHQDVTTRENLHASVAALNKLTTPSIQGTDSWQSRPQGAYSQMHLDYQNKQATSYWSTATSTSASTSSPSTPQNGCHVHPLGYASQQSHSPREMKIPMRTPGIWAPSSSVLRQPSPLQQEQPRPRQRRRSSQGTRVSSQSKARPEEKTASEPLSIESSPVLKAAGRPIFTSVAHSFDRAVMGYSVYFGPNDSRNRHGCYAQDKSVHRSEIRAMLHAVKQIFGASIKGEPQSKCTIYTCHEYSAKRASWPPIDANEISYTRGAPCMDLILQIRSLISWLRSRNCEVHIELVHREDGVSQTLMRQSQTSAEEGTKLAAGEDQDQSLKELEYVAGPKDHTLLCASASVSSDQASDKIAADGYQRIYTDGSTVLRAGETVAGYGVYFGLYDPRNECAPVLGKGTGPRASLAGILRALDIITNDKHGQKKWEVVSCRGQYVTSAFELSAAWQLNGWKRNAGKPIANLDIYREIRRLLNNLEARGYEVKGKYISQQALDHGLMIADLLARKGAGDESIEFPVEVLTSFQVPSAPEDTHPSVLYCAATYDRAFRSGFYGVYFGHNDSRNKTGPCGSMQHTLDKCAAYSITRALRVIETGADRNWKFIITHRDLATTINDYSTTKRKKPPPIFIESVLKHLQRLRRHGYRITISESSSDDTIAAATVQSVNDAALAEQNTNSPAPSAAEPAGFTESSSNTEVSAETTCTEATTESSVEGTEYGGDQCDDEAETDSTDSEDLDGKASQPYKHSQLLDGSIKLDEERSNIPFPR